MELMELLKTRRTYRRFDQKRPIPDDVVADILKAQQYASCANNRQPLRYLVVRTPELVEKVFALTKWAAALPPEEGTPKDGEHPTLFVVVMEEKALQNKWTDTDAGIAINNMTLAAWNKGVGSCIMASVAREPLKALLNIGEEKAVHTVIAFGYPTHQSFLKEAKPGESLNYYLDENRDYVVPRRPIDEVASFL